jgi:UDP-N-acetylmuramoyl-L-alanyl-D-glutamate--2,6-diaminopimelate ligase
MRLDRLLESLILKRIEGTPQVHIRQLQVDSRKAKAGDCFICLPGQTVDGHIFALDAVANGAIAVITEKDLYLAPHITKVYVPDTRRAMAILSDTFYRHPSHRLRLIGVTGTNGKTTTTHMIEQILNESGRKTGLLGTIHMRVGNQVTRTVNTTPDALELQKYFRTMLDEGATHAVMEVSSHALGMGRVRGCDFDTVIFTNLTHDHLDYHKTMEQYGNVKSLLFSQLGNSYKETSKVAILNADDEISEQYKRGTAAQVITYGIHNRADVCARGIEVQPSGVSFIVDTFQGSASLQLRVTGVFNVYNALAAVAACLVEGVTLEDICAGMEAFEGVPGRFELTYSGDNVAVIVDYAHNPDGLRHVLQVAKRFTSGRLYCVVGCEGDRDKLKRPVMANVAAEYSDFAIFTSDNPRSEDPEDILRDMCAGLVMNSIPSARYTTIVDRREAIHHALQRVQPGDYVLIAGKGHETNQIVKDNLSIPLDDRKIVLEYMGTPVWQRGSGETGFLSADSFQ